MALPGRCARSKLPIALPDSGIRVVKLFDSIDRRLFKLSPNPLGLLHVYVKSMLSELRGR